MSASLSFTNERTRAMLMMRLPLSPQFYRVASDQGEQVISGQYIHVQSNLDISKWAPLLFGKSKSQLFKCD